MKNNLKIINSNRQEMLLTLNKIKTDLSRSMEDINLYYYMLIALVENINQPKFQKKGYGYLVDQDKLREILKELIKKAEGLLDYWNGVRFDSRFSIKKFREQLNQIQIEISIFKDIHFSVKKRYYKFMQTNFCTSWLQVVRVA